MEWIAFLCGQRVAGVSCSIRASSAFQAEVGVEEMKVAVERTGGLKTHYCPLMWFIVVIFTLVDVHGWHVYLWVSYIPLLIVLVLGTKLEVVVATMALQISNQNTVIRGTPLVEPNDNLFWFGRPKFVLTLLHFTLFMNAFELAFFIWVTIQFGVNSCYHGHTGTIVTRVVLAVTVQVLCSYITLPLYALVTQMGSAFNGKVVVEEQMTKILKQWHIEVKGKRKAQQSQTLQSPRASLSMEPSSISGGSPNELPSPHRVSISSPSDSFHYYSEGEIVEEQEDKVTNFASSSSMAPSGTCIQEMPMVMPFLWFCFMEAKLQMDSNCDSKCEVFNWEWRED